MAETPPPLPAGPARQLQARRGELIGGTLMRPVPSSTQRDARRIECLRDLRGFSAARLRTQL
jgi:hypothetical protein